MCQGIFSKGLSSMQSLCLLMCIVLCLFIWKPSLWRGLLNNSQALITWRIIRRSHLDLGKLQDRKKKRIQRSFRQLLSTERYCFPPRSPWPHSPPPLPNTSILQGHWAISENIFYFHGWGWRWCYWHLEGRGLGHICWWQPAVCRTVPTTKNYTVCIVNGAKFENPCSGIVHLMSK